VRIIDDLVYDGLEFPGEAPGFSFSQIDDLRSDVIVLLGLSKLGLAGLRAGLMVADQSIIRRAYRLQVGGSYFPNRPAMCAIERYYGGEEPYRTWRSAHLALLTRTHEFAGKLMLALIDGLGAVERLTEQDKTELVGTVCKAKGIDRDAAMARLMRPIGKVRVVTRPRAGFFHMLDFSALKGMHFRTASGARVGPVQDEYGLEKILTDEGFYLCFGVWTGLTKDVMLQRVTFAIPKDAIVAAIDRLEDLLSRFEPMAKNYNSS
jgi:aspartate/methionine/tyrosine aminotransferase